MIHTKLKDPTSLRARRAKQSLKEQQVLLRLLRRFAALRSASRNDVIIALFFCLILINPTFCRADSAGCDGGIFKEGFCMQPDAEKVFPNLQVDAEKKFPNLQVDAEKKFPNLPVNTEKEFPNLQVNAEKVFCNK